MAPSSTPQKRYLRVGLDEAFYHAVIDQSATLNFKPEQFIVDAVERELRRRGVTWWETRTDKVVREVIGD